MKNKLIILTIGFSAGGFDPLLSLLTKFNFVDQCTFIIASHLSISEKNKIIVLIEKLKKYKIIFAENSLKLNPNTIYIAPDNKDIYVKEKRIYLKDIESSIGIKPSINYLFMSVAKEFKENVIGIILSGIGNDGALGIKNIKSHGGITIAQSTISSKYQSMPHFAIETGKIDLIEDINNIHNVLFILVKNLKSDINFEGKEETINKIINLLSEKTKIDFFIYNKTLIIKKIKRRMNLKDILSLEEYYKYLKLKVNELDNLNNDCIPDKTFLFVDMKYFDFIKPYLLNLVKRENKEIRIWCIGCSTGVEAYYIAIILSEILQNKINDYHIKIFATDINKKSINYAKKGIFNKILLLGFNKNLLRKYFIIKADNYEINENIKKLIIFSTHDISVSSPFLRQDIVICNDVIKDFNEVFYEKFFLIIHYALKEKGVLLINRLDSKSKIKEFFIKTSKKEQIYEKKVLNIKQESLLNNSLNKYFKENLNSNLTENENIVFENSIVLGKRNLFNKCIILDNFNNILYIKGENPYIKFKEGEISSNIFDVIDKRFSLELRKAIENANINKVITSTLYKKVDKNHYLKIIVVPIENFRLKTWLNILFFEMDKEALFLDLYTLNNNVNQIIRILYNELNSTKNYLQKIIEDFDFSNKKLQNLNKELTNLNNDIQNINKKLLSENLDLKSKNVELETEYSALKVLYNDKENRVNELEKTINDIDNIHIKNSDSSQLDFYELSMFDINTYFKNELNELSLLIDLEDNTNSNLFSFKEKISLITKRLEEKISFFNLNLFNRKISIESKIKIIFEEYTELLNNYKISINLNIDNFINETFNNEITLLNYKLIKLFLNIKLLKKEVLVINLDFMENKIIISINNVDLNNYAKLIESIMHSNNYDIKLNKNSLQILKNGVVYENTIFM